MPRLAEIIAFLSLSEGALAPEVQAQAIRRRWPDATGEEVCEALERAAEWLPDGAVERAALDAAALAILGPASRRRRPQPVVVEILPEPDSVVRAPFRRHQ